jgi:hypothetical protein
MAAILRHPRRHQARRVRHPDPQHRADDLIDQGIRHHSISTWRTDRQELESRTKQIKALAFKGCSATFPILTASGSVLWRRLSDA